MNRLLIPIAALGLVVVQGTAWAGDAAEKAEACFDCHEMDEFAGRNGAEILAAAKEANASNDMMAEAAAGLSDADLEAIANYLAAEAGK